MCDIRLYEVIRVFLIVLRFSCSCLVGLLRYHAPSVAPVVSQQWLPSNAIVSIDIDIDVNTFISGYRRMLYTTGINTNNFGREVRIPPW